MADVALKERREPYIGEKRKFLRDGFGTYVYENQFFRYEGEWMKGKKHGHGKLQMKDGTYYEGQFINGEINGNGYKFFSSSQAKYTGQFLNGEMHGHGTMNYKNGHQYEGQWYKNKKQGFGVLRTSDRAVYEGTFQSHVRDGEGTQTYDYSYQKLSNGDRYEGYWVLDQRQGHGELWCADGTHYSGQFMHDLFNGEGTMTHASGIVYRGNWVNGLPITMATKIVLLVEEGPMIIRQGQPFSVRVECRNDDDELIEDQGRELQVIAGFKYRKPKEGSALFDIIEDVEEKPIPTPYYDVVPYPLTDQLSEVQAVTDVSDESDAKAAAAKTEEEAEDKGEEDGEDEGLDENAPSKETPADEAEVAAGMATLSVGDGADLMPPEGSQPVTPVEAPSEDIIDDVKGAKSEEVTQLLPPVQSKPTDKGVCEWQNLQLAPPPPMYRPFVIMEEEAGPKKKSKLAQIRDKMEEEEHEEEGSIDGDENEVSGDEQRVSFFFGDDDAEDLGKTEEGNDKEDIEKNKAEEESGIEGKEEPKVEREGEVAFIEENFDETPRNLVDASSQIKFKIEDSLDEIDAEKRNSMNPLGGKPVVEEKPAVPEEKFARTGEYILVVQDVTSPPFMGRRLEPAYLVLKLKKPKRIIVKKPKCVTIIDEEGEEEEVCDEGGYEELSDDDDDEEEEDDPDAYE